MISPSLRVLLAQQKEADIAARAARWSALHPPSEPDGPRLARPTLWRRVLRLHVGLALMARS